MRYAAHVGATPLTKFSTCRWNPAYYGHELAELFQPQARCMHVLPPHLDVNNRSEPTLDACALDFTAVQVGTFQHGCKAVPCCQRKLTETRSITRSRLDRSAYK